MSDEPLDVEGLAREMLLARDSGTLVVPPTQRYPDLDFATAYRVAAAAIRLRRARGERPVGRKIGYTNRNIWAEYNVQQPIWDHVYEQTLHDAARGRVTLPAAGMVAPRIEPEIAFRLRGPPPVGCDDPAIILGSVESVALAVEVVDCHYAGWRFAGPDSVIDFSHHAALVVGETASIGSKLSLFVEWLRDCRVTFLRDGVVVAEGVGANALGHPALALAALANIIASQPESAPLEAGEVITTGTLTTPMPAIPHSTWRAEASDRALPPVEVAFS